MAARRTWSQWHGIWRIRGVCCSFHAVLCLSAVAQPVQKPPADICCYAPQEIGPYTIGFGERKHNWASRANLLFIDNPVGTGFSYVEPHANFCESPQPHMKLLPAFLSVQWARKAVPYSACCCWASQCHCLPHQG